MGVLAVRDQHGGSWAGRDSDNVDDEAGEVLVGLLSVGVAPPRQLP
jgi:hypothetical protein